MRGDNWPAEPTVSMPGLRSPRAVPRGHGRASPAPLAFTVPLCQGNVPLEKESQRILGTALPFWPPSPRQ